MGDPAAGKQRVLWIDILRGAAILFVVLAHTPTPLFKLICGFTLPLFFMITGYLWKPKPVREHAKRLILPYFILCAVNLALDCGMLFLKHEEIPLQRFLIGIFYSRGTVEWMPNCTPLWALTAFFCALVMFESIQRLNREAVKAALVVAGAAVSGLLSFFEVFKLPWNIDSALMGVVFVYAGHWMKRAAILDKMEKMPNVRQALLLSFISIAGLIAIFSNPDSASYNNNRYGNVFLMLPGAFAVCFVLFSLFRRIPWKGPAAKYLSCLGRHTVFIMGFDYFSKTVMGNALAAIRCHHWVTLFAAKTVMLTLGCLVWNWCVHKIGNESVRKALSF